MSDGTAKGPEPPVAAPVQPVCKAWWCGSGTSPGGAVYFPGSSTDYDEESGEAARYCSEACADAGRHLNPPAEVPPGQVAGEDEALRDLEENEQYGALGVAMAQTEIERAVRDGIASGKIRSTGPGMTTILTADDVSVSVLAKILASCGYEIRFSRVEIPPKTDAPAPAAPAKASEPKPESLLDKLRGARWAVAVHNDYRQHGVSMTFWLFTHPSGRWVKGEGPTDDIALAKAWEQASAAAPEAQQGDAKASEPEPSWMRDHKQDARLAVHAGFLETPVGAPSCAEVLNPLHSATIHSYVCDAMTDVVVESVKQATAAQWRRNAELVAQLATAEKERDEAKGLVEVAHVANAQFYAETTAARAEVEQWKGWTAEARLERDAANERANETGCELDGVRYEVEQLRAKLADETEARLAAENAAGELLEENAAVIRRADAAEADMANADARELAMRDACAKVARDRLARLNSIDLTEYGRGERDEAEWIAMSIERLPVGAGEASK